MNGKALAFHGQGHHDLVADQSGAHQPIAEVVGVGVERQGDLRRQLVDGRHGRRPAEPQAGDDDGDTESGFFGLIGAGIDLPGLGAVLADDGQGTGQAFLFLDQADVGRRAQRPAGGAVIGDGPEGDRRHRRDSEAGALSLGRAAQRVEGSTQRIGPSAETAADIARRAGIERLRGGRRRSSGGSAGRGSRGPGRRARGRARRTRG